MPQTWSLTLMTLMALPICLFSHTPNPYPTHYPTATAPNLCSVGTQWPGQSHGFFCLERDLPCQGPLASAVCPHTP